MIITCGIYNPHTALIDDDGLLWLGATTGYQCINTHNLIAQNGTKADARFAVQIGNAAPQVFSIHAKDFSAEWRLNVLRGYASRSLSLPSSCHGPQKVRIYLLDPGIVLQEICVF